MSALVYPGIGQCMQKRWIAGTLNILAFSLAGGWFVFELTRIFIAYFSQAFFDKPALASPGYARMLAAFGLTMLLYAISLADTCLAHARAMQRHSASKSPVA